MRLQFLLFLFLCLPPAFFGQYSQKTSKNVMFMNLCADANNPDVCVTQHFSYIILKTFTADCSDLIWAGQCQASVLYSEVDQAVAIFFRGPKGQYTNFKSSAASKLAAMSLTPFQTAFGSVGSDYSIAFDRLWNGQGLGAYMQETWSTYCDYALLLSGHSVGSCLAQMAAVALKPMNLWTLDQIIYYGYGTPRCGNQDFAATVDTSAGIRYRVNWLKDNIPLYPAKSCSGTGNAVYGSGQNCWYHCCNSMWLASSILGIDNWKGECVAEDTKCLGGSSSSDHTAYWSTTQAQYDNLNCGSTMTFQPDP